MEISVQNIWFMGWIILVGLTLCSLIVVSATYKNKPCYGMTPILLSEAFTTKPWRGIVIFCNFFAAIISIYSSKFITLSFILFGSAFIISMFDTPSTHDELILFGAFIIMIETCPWFYKEKIPSLTWKIHWCTTFVSAITCISWMTSDDKCSWWYITEYIFFWQLYLLVYWRIDKNLKFADTSRTERIEGK